MARGVTIGTLTLVAWLGLATHAHSLDVDVLCPASVKSSSQVNVTIKLRNTDPFRTVTIDRGIVGGHLGNLNVIGPIAFAASFSLPPGGTTQVPFSFTMPGDAPVGFFVTVGFGFFGKVGLGPNRVLLGSEGCAIEISP